MSENSNPQASVAQNENEKMIEENTIRLEPLFSSGDYYYDSYKTAQLFAKDLNSVGVMTIVDIKIENDTEYPEDILLAFITDETGKKYWATLDAHTGFVAVIYDENGKALFWKTDD